MSADNIETLRRGLEAFSSGDIERILAFVHPDFVGTVPPQFSTEPDTYRGHDGIRRYFRSFDEAMDEVRFEPERFWDAGDSVVVTMRLRARGKQTAIPVEQRFAQVWTLRDGRAIGVDVYASLDEAFTAAGLSQPGRMEHDNASIVRSVYAAWAQGDLPGPRDVLDARIQYVNPPSAIEPGTRDGLEAFTRAVEATFQGWETWAMEPEQLAAVGDQVAVVVRYRARGRGSGVEVDGRESALWTIKDGKVVRYEWFRGPEDALRAAQGRA
jgi:ketosteroid isomerase-like protein